MNGARKRALLWRMAGFLCYLAGMVLFLVVGASVFLAPPVYSFENIGDLDVATLFLSVGLLVTGRLVSWKYGADVTEARESVENPWRQRQQSPLEELGYHVPPEDSERPESGYTYDDGEIQVVCRECGAENEPGYTYCGNCSAELPT